VAESRDSHHIYIADSFASLKSLLKPGREDGDAAASLHEALRQALHVPFDASDCGEEAWRRHQNAHLGGRYRHVERPLDRIGLKDELGEAQCACRPQDSSL
jgi:hypothetical protein